MYVPRDLETRERVVSLTGAKALQISIATKNRNVFTVLDTYRALTDGPSLFLEDLSALVPTLPTNSIKVGDVHIDLNPNNNLDKHSLTYENLLITFGFFNFIHSPTR